MRRRLRQARTVTLVGLAVNASMSLFLPAVGLVRESDVRWVVLGAVGITAFAVAQAFVLYVLITPWITPPTRRRATVAFAAAALISVPLVGPVGDGWPTWSWLAACLVGLFPVLTSTTPATLLAAATGAAAVALTPDRRLDALVITLGFGLGIAAVNRLQVWFWDLLVEAERGRGAQAQLAAAEERLRFARDVHDLLGHNLSVIALKAELVERLATIDAERAGSEAAEVRRIAASTLTELREVVHGYRRVDLRDQLTAIRDLLRSSGVSCTVTAPDRELPATVTDVLSATLREATTNVLRHSRAHWCTITIQVDEDRTRMTLVNDGVLPSTSDEHSSGLRGLRDRLAEAGGELRTTAADGHYTLEAVVPSTP
ncbi:sensor histidine kinase [Cryptosporangium phraense]|uniref:Histidine kinase n=1 Tax=Cryptosporangium phraense TaxID=2593070 RepID=A0A545AX74_9ACTN|nr:histidine kinase [Cryptosporangium phraense]TQS45881.1 histidine kinase [Cryptosporangium phraense]